MAPMESPEARAGLGPIPDGAAPPEGVYRPGYFDTRLTDDPNRGVVWKHICDYFTRWIRPTDDVLELGAGRCDFANAVTAGTRDRDGPRPGRRRLGPDRASRPWSATAPT